ncbi:MAG: site-2 protease family protein, partial [Chloroflexota bacterium]|nr:site-2 protease family protein [Chloroflexota bacterium]
HEFSHALVAFAQGDLTAKQQGRLSLNPMRHLDPLGSLMLLIMAIAGFGIGWGKPTPVNPVNLRNGRRSMALVSVAGVIANLSTAVAAGLVWRLHWIPTLVLRGYLAPSVGDLIGGRGGLISALIAVNIGLAVFNLLPIAPLDGFNFLVNVVPESFGFQVSKYAHWGPGILMLLIFLPQFIPGFRDVNLLATVLEPPFRLLEHLIVGV